jgi:DNA mismatch repair protein MutS2
LVGVQPEAGPQAIDSPAAPFCVRTPHQLEESPLHQATMNMLSFPQILDQLASFAACDLGKDLAQNIRPLTSLKAIQGAQNETTEAKAVLRKGKSVPFGGIHDVRRHLRRALAGDVLRPADLLDVADTARGCVQLHSFLSEQREVAPALALKAALFGRFDQIVTEVERCIEHGAVSDRASKELKEIRREIAVLNGRIQDRLQALIRRPDLKTHLQEALVTTRAGRFVIPVRAASKQFVPGAVHGASASGATLFVEPEAIRGLCEELETWQAMAEAEEERVLMMLSGHVAAVADSMLATLEVVAELDLVFAKGRLSYAWDAGPVRWNEEGVIDLRGARHPLLGRDAVPNRIRLDGTQRMLIVTGPNTGGKTLLLKTLGILVILAHCGLHIPVEAESTLCRFQDVQADIGDAQSLEQSLSTFSGHIATVAPMLATASPRSLILLDELGSGTDPHEGTGLGIAILEALLAKGAYVLATTHLREIKEFGRLTPGCRIAGMGFDGESLRPTYRLQEGALGESHGLVIAARAGLPAAVVARAHELVHGGLAVLGRGAAASAPAETAPTGGAELYERAAATGVADRTRQKRRSLRLPVPVGAALADEPAVAEIAALGQSGRSAETAAIGQIGRLAETAAPGQSTRYAETHAVDVTASRVAQPTEGDDWALVIGSPLPGRLQLWQGGTALELPVKPALRKRLHGLPVVGDRVRIAGEQVAEVAKRESLLVRRSGGKGAQPIAANLTQLLIVLSARQPDFRPNTLDRHLIYAEQHGLRPLICLTKADLVSPATQKAWLQPYQALGYETVSTSVTKGWGIDRLQSLLAGELTAVIGHSGVGKSSLLGAVTGAALKVGAVNEAKGAPGRHTTTNATAIPLPGGGWVIDTPGLRELGFWNLTLGDLQAAFPEFRRFTGLCRFHNCTHLREPECGVQLAANQGQIDPRRYAHYKKLAGEIGR